ncbi:hypothetical protein RND81_05G110400 [Saponaria officinalis]|uniref:Uncharacterized protein n=1 Tax=Saponaria officinalis TaxID=3572 RepID=A0AAW1KWU1_SAPOF
MKESNDYVALEITQLEPPIENLTSSIKAKLETILFPCTIFSVPNRFLTQNENVYQPTLISIGAMHHGKTHLQHMENHKWDYLNSLLGRKLLLHSNYSIIDSCVTALKELEPKIRACYEDNYSIQSDDFVRMMLLDGGFIIELFLRYSIKGLRRRDDPLFRSPEKFNNLRSDLILLENQIPFFVLRALFSIVPLPKQCDRTISQLSLRFFKGVIPGDVDLLQERYNFEGSNHLLDLIWKCYIPSSSKLPLSSGSEFGRIIHSASKLQEAGIKVKTIEAESVMDVKFVQGSLIIPSLTIHNHMEIVFRNLIAMEHCHVEKTKHVTSYAFLMKGLIQSEIDVNLLFRRGILHSYVGKKEEVINMFKKLCENIDLDKFYYEGMWEQINGYGRTRWDVWCYKLKHKSRQFHCKYSGAVLGVAILIFVLICILFCALYLFIRRRRS